MTGFIYEIKDHLVAQGVGAYNTNIFISSKAAIPTGAGPYLVLTDTGGSGAARTQTSAAERPSTQISVRATSSVDARVMMAAAYAALGGADGLHNVTLGGIFYLSITCRQSNPVDIGSDDAGRAMFSMNFDAEKAPS